MYTAQDCIEMLLATTGGGAQDQEHRVLRQAVYHAYRDLVTVRDWRWHHTVDEIGLLPEELVTTYVLPWGTQSVDAVALTYPMVTAEYVSPTDWERIVHSQLKQMARLVWTILPSKEVPDRFEVKLLNGYRYGQCATLTYRRRPRDLRFTGWEKDNRTGTISWDGRTAIGTGTSWSNQVTGCVLRVSGDSKKAPEPLTGMNPYRDEALIYRVDNGSVLHTIGAPNNVNYQDTRFVITDLLDVSPGMLTALLSGSELWAARLLGKNIEGAAGVYGRDLRMAFESDAAAPLSGRRSSAGGFYSFWYLRAGTDQGCTPGGKGGPNANGTCHLPHSIDGGTSSSTYDNCGGTP